MSRMHWGSAKRINGSMIAVSDGLNGNQAMLCRLEIVMRLDSHARVYVYVYTALPLSVCRKDSDDYVIVGGAR